MSSLHRKVSRKTSQLWNTRDNSLIKLIQQSKDKQKENQKQLYHMHRRFQSDRIQGKDNVKNNGKLLKKIIGSYLSNAPIRKIDSIQPKTKDLLGNQIANSNIKRNSNQKNEHNKLKRGRKFISNIFLNKQQFLNESFTSKKIKLKSIDNREAWMIDISVICKCLQELCSKLTTSKKVNKICYNYFALKNKGLAQIFINLYQNKRSLNNEMICIVIKDQVKLIQKIRKILDIMSQKQQYLFYAEINMYRNFLQQHIQFVNKNLICQVEREVKRNIKGIKMKGCNKLLCKNENRSPQFTNLFSEIQKIEQSCGNFSFVTLKNKKKLQNLHESQDNIIKIMQG